MVSARELGQVFTRSDDGQHRVARRRERHCGQRRQLPVRPQELDDDLRGTVASADDRLGQAVLMHRCRVRVPAPRSSFAGFRFPPEVITVAVRWYLRYGLSYRDVEELLAERGIEVDHVTVFRWVQRFTLLLVDAARPGRHVPGDRWFADETYVKVAGRWVYLYRAIDQYGQVIDVLVSEKRDLAATRRFFTRAIDHGTYPSAVTTDKASALSSGAR
jgi:hypothetical protein